MSSVPFDPYHKWLGIPQRDQPAHHYRLLGIPAYEDDPQVVEAAADRQMAFLRKFQTGEHSADALKLLNEISRARICLLKPDTKAAYDVALRATLNEAAPPAPIQINTALTGAGRPVWMSPAVLGGAGATLVGLLIVIVLLSAPKPLPQPQPAATDSGNSTPAVPEVAGPAIPVEKAPTTVSSGANPASKPLIARKLPKQDRPLAQGDKAPWPTLVGSEPEAATKPGQKSSTASSNKPVKQPVVAQSGSSTVVNLLTRVDVNQHRIAGQWTAENQQLVSPSDGMTRLGVPYTLPNEYDLTLKVERTSGKRGFGLVFPVQGHPAQLLIDAQNGTQTKLGNGVARSNTEHERLFDGQLLPADRPVEFLLQVRRGRVALAADGKEILNWKGDPAASFVPTTNENFTNPIDRELMLISVMSSFRVSKLEFSPPQKSKWSESKPETVDLLSRVDPQRNSPLGDWTLKDGTLTGSSEPANRLIRLEVPFQPTAAEYDLAISITREEAKGACIVGLQVQGHQCLLLLVTDGQDNLFGISDIDDQTGAQNETTKRAAIPASGLPFLIKCRVRQQAITVESNGDKVIDWRGDPARLSVPSYVVFPDPKALMLGVQGGTFRFNSFTFSAASDDSSAGNPDIAGTKTSPEMSADSALQIPKQPTPDAAAQDAARKLVRDTFKVEYALAKKADARHLDAKLNLAKSLLARAESTTEDPAASYVMLSDGAEFAAESGQLALAWEILVALGDRFDLPSLPLMERATKAASRLAKSDEDIAYLASMYVLLLDEAVRLDDFETAAKAAPAAAGATRKNLVLKEQLASYARRVNVLRDAFEAAKAAKDVLKVNPDDETANLAWGRYVCFYKGDWLTGLPLLAKSSNAALASLAKREVDQSRELQALTQLGDDWWAVAEQEKDPVRATIRERAVDAWQLALPLASGLQKQALETKVERIFKPTKFFETTGKGQGISVANPELNPGPYFTVEFWIATQAKSGILLSKREDRRDSGIVVGLDRGRPNIAGRSSSGSSMGRSRQVINDGRWHHIAVVKMGHKLGLFVDGKWTAQTEFADTYLSGSPWKVGHDGQSRSDEPEAKFCRIRFSKEPRYLVSFHPEKTYAKDKGTIFIP